MQKNVIHIFMTNAIYFINLDKNDISKHTKREGTWNTTHKTVAALQNKKRFENCFQDIFDF